MSILEDILQQNTKDGIREEYLNCILKALISSYDIYKLKSYGITIKDEKNKHPIAMFLIIQDINLRFHPHQVIKMPADRFTDNLENTF